MSSDPLPAGHTASSVVKGVVRKTAVITLAGTVAAVALQLTAWPGLDPWRVPAGILVGGALGVFNFRWLAYAVERVYLRTGGSSVLANVAGAVIWVLKLSAIFIILFVVIRHRLVNLVGLVIGLTFCFGAIMWQGFALVTDLKADRS